MNGIKIVLPGSKVTDTDTRKVAYSSSDKRLNVKIGQQPPHLGALVYTFNSKPADPSGGATINYPIATIKHGLGYTPATMVYMYISYPPNDPTAATSLIPALSYYPLPVALNLSSNTPQIIACTADAQTLQIYYSVTDQTAFGFAPPYPDVTGMSFIFKYYIFVNPGA